ncbi:MAG: hypothetical protein QOG03_1148 [Actinomycetota bacterium]|nr:hypothetical protein [Actinomycetota bacterium]
MEQGLTPAQDNVRRDLMAAGQPRPTFDDGLARSLRNQLTEATASIAERLELLGTELVVRKADLSRVHQCEGWSEAEQAEGFPGWTPARAKGTIAHKAVELSAFIAEGHSRPPLELVDLAIDRTIQDGDDYTPRPWLLEASAVELGELRSGANDLVAKFLESFPPLKPKWRPRLESPVTLDLHNGTISLRSRVDLALGRAEGREAHVLLVDFKSGRAHAGHVDDLRFYALLETLRSGVPPFRVATYYLDAGTWSHEDIDIDILASATRRVVAGVTKLAELRMGERAPTLTAGAACGWCPARLGCEAADAAAAAEAAFD